MCFSEDSRFLIFITDSLREVFFYLVPQSDNEKPVLYKSFKLNIIGSIRRLFSSGTNDNLVLYTACLENDNIIKVYDSTGKKITQEDIKQNVIYDIECSNNGQFISPASFCSGVKVYECGRTREGMYKKFNQIMTLNGHKSGVTAVGFGDKRTRMITVSKDKTWKIWGISVRYNEGGEPHLLYSYPTELNVQFALLSETYNIAILIAEGDIYYYNSETGKELEHVIQPHNGYISYAVLSNNGEEILIMGRDDKHASLWKLPN